MKAGTILASPNSFKFTLIFESKTLNDVVFSLFFYPKKILRTIFLHKGIC